MPHYIMNTCIGCTMCAKSCPVDAIDGKTKEMHVINNKRCIDCGVCGKVCPKSAVINQHRNPVPKTAKEYWLKPSVDASICSACAMCVDICKFSCLEITYPKFKGDLKVYASLEKPKSCVDCGLCAKICPLNAIRMKGVTKNE